MYLSLEKSSVYFNCHMSTKILLHSGLILNANTFHSVTKPKVVFFFFKPKDFYVNSQIIFTYLFRTSNCIITTKSVCVENSFLL